MEAGFTKIVTIGFWGGALLSQGRVTLARASNALNNLAVSQLDTSALDALLFAEKFAEAVQLWHLQSVFLRFARAGSFVFL